MKLFCILSIYIVTSTTFGLLAQSNLLPDKKWKIEKSSATFRNETVLFFHKDSTTNTSDYSKMELSFFNNGSYKIKNESIEESGKWKINTKGDSLLLDNINYHLVEISKDHLTTRRFKVEFADTAANLDTVWYYTSYRTVKTDTVTALPQLDEIGDFSINPNPTNGILKIQYSSEQSSISIKHVILRNVAGQFIKTIPFTTTKKTVLLDIGDERANIYFIELLDTRNRRIGLKKIIKK